MPLDGDWLAGWWLPSQIPPAATLLYPHGDAGNISADADQLRRLASTGLNIFIFDYRGYGESMGGAVAIELARRHPDAGGLVTESTLLSIVDAADGTVFGWS